MKTSIQPGSPISIWLARVCFIVFIISLPVLASAADEWPYPGEQGVYAWDGGRATLLFNGYPGRTAAEKRMRLTFSRDVAILVVGDSPAGVIAETATTAIFDWVSMGQQPPDRVPSQIKPVEGHLNMVLVIPKQPLTPGLYSMQMGDNLGMGKGTPDYQFGVETVDVAAYWLWVLTIKPNSWQAHNHLGAELYLKGDVKEALVHFSKAIELNPKNPESHNNVGLALSALGKNGDAIEQYETAVGLMDASSLRPNLKSSIETNLANSYSEAKRYDDAIQMYRRAIKLQPTNAAAHCNLGWALMQQGHVDDAIPEFQETVRLDPDMPQAKSDLEQALRKKGGGTGP